MMRLDAAGGIRTDPVTDAEPDEAKYPKKDADVGLQLLASSGRIEYTAEEARRVKRKVDLFILPIVPYILTLFRFAAYSR